MKLCAVVAPLGPYCVAHKYLDLSSEFGPHNMTLHTGVWTIRYSSSDESNNTAFVEKFVTVQDTTDPRITLQGA